MFIFLVTKFLILPHEDSLKRGLTAIHFYVAITTFINAFYIIFKGSPGLSLSTLPIGSILGISFGVAGAVFLWCFFFLRPYLSRRIEGSEPLRWYHSFCTPFAKTRFRRASAHVETVHPSFHEKSAKIDSSSVHSDDTMAKHQEEALKSPRGSVDSSLAALDDTPAPSEGKAVFNKLKAKLTYGLD
jgi:sodium-dependent phosphate transporter